MEIQTPEKIELEYQSLRSDNNFKTYANGKNLFFKWRQGLVDHNHLAQKFGVSPEALMNAERRLNKKSFTKEQYDEIKKLRDNHIDQVSETQKKIKDYQDLTKIGTTNDTPKRKRDLNDYSQSDHLEEILSRIDADETTDTVELALMIHRYVFMHEFSQYDQLRKLSDDARKLIDLYSEQGWKSASLAKTINDMLDKKVDSLEKKIRDIITNYGTLYEPAVVETISDQQKKLEKITDFVMKEMPEKMALIVSMLDDAVLE